MTGTGTVTEMFTKTGAGKWAERTGTLTGTGTDTGMGTLIQIGTDTGMVRGTVIGMVTGTGIRRGLENIESG